MKLSYEGVGQWAAAFACSDVKVGDLVKIVGDGQVEACEAGDRFCGQVISCSSDGKTCTVAMGGMLTVSNYDVQFLGWNTISAAGRDNIQEDADGTVMLVVAMDDAARTATIVL